MYCKLWIETYLILQGGNGWFKVIRQQGFASNLVEIRINQCPVIQILAKTSN